MSSSTNPAALHHIPCGTSSISSRTNYHTVVRCWACGDITAFISSHPFDWRCITCAYRFDSSCEIRSCYESWATKVEGNIPWYMGPDTVHLGRITEHQEEYMIAAERKSGVKRCIDVGYAWKNKTETRKIQLKKMEETRRRFGQMEISR